MTNVSNPMPIKHFINVATVLPMNISVLLRGDHGIGKSQVVHRLATIFRDKNFPDKKDAYPVIDRRLSQVTEGDIIGLPSTDGNVTRFNPPDWYMQACKEPCVLFLDELNRATPEVMQAAFQIVLDRELNGHHLHAQTRVYAAVNSSHAYQVNEIDPALLDRFFVVDLVPTTEDWLLWAKEDDGSGKSRVDLDMVEFIQTHDKWLDIPKVTELGAVATSRRSWERLSNSVREAKLDKTPEDLLYYSIATGFVGVECASVLREFVTAPERRVSGEEILNSWKKVEKKVKSLGQERMNIAIERVADYVKTLDTLSKKQQDNLAAFSMSCTDELKVHLFTTLISLEPKKIEIIKTVNQAINKQILDVFGVDPENPDQSDFKYPDWMKEKEEKATKEADAAVATK